MGEFSSMLDTIIASAEFRKIFEIFGGFLGPVVTEIGWCLKVQYDDPVIDD
jgi:hypothetical protein